MKLSATLIPALLLTSFALGATNPLWLRDVEISPDGSTIAFCYKGDVYAVPSAGGEAIRLTTQDSYECAPVWSPDGKTIAFASNRYGNFDVFAMSVADRATTRLTFNSSSELPRCFTPDGKAVLFGAVIQDPASSIIFPSGLMSELYSVPIGGGKISQVLATPADELSWSADGSFFIYQDKKGFEDELRKHHISSVTRDIWLYDTATCSHTNLTNRPGEDLDPVLSPDGKTVYFISEPKNTPDGHPRAEGWGTSLNVYSFSLDEAKTLAADAKANGSEAKAPAFKQVSSFATHPVRFLSIGAGKLCYTYNGEIYTQVPGSEASKVRIDIVRDEENIPELMSASSGSPDAAVSPDGKQIAFIVRGEVFVTSVDYTTTKRITTTAAAESDVIFGADGRSVIYVSDRSGVCQLYEASIVRKEDPNFANATLIEEKPLFECPGVDRRQPRLSPDGKHLAFVQDRNCLMVGTLASGKVSQVTDGSCWPTRSDSFSYRWSPDGKWFTLEYIPNGHSPYSDIGLVSAKGGEITNITGSGYSSQNPKFTADGSAIMFQSERFGMRSHASWGSQDDVFLCFLTQDAFDKFRLSKEDYELRKEAEKGKAKKDEKKGDDASDSEKAGKKTKDIEVELEGIQDRIVRLTPNSSSLGDAIITKDGENLYYIAYFEGDGDLWKMNLRKKETKLVSKACGSGSFVTDAEGKTIFLLGRSFKKMEGDSFKGISYRADYKLDHAAEREYMFDYVYREEKERFYDAGMHGMDWDGLCANYRRFLPHIANNYDFADMLSELLGELNVSHTGASYRPSLGGETTGNLGLFFDWNYTGKGLKVDEIVKGGPFDHANLSIKAGDVITAIDGQSVENGTDILLAGKAGKKVLVEVKGKGEMVVIPITRSQNNDLLYKRWVRQRAADVEKWSGGRLGYVHIKSMNDASYRDIYSDILGKYNKCEGIVIDIRFNGGGRLHEDVEVLFTGKKYLTQLVRGTQYCDMPSRRWNKPSIMVTCEADYSNAHGTPWVYRTRNIGKIVGAPVPGTMTSVNWVRLIDNTLTFGIPVTGYMTDGGYYLENDQLEPDVKVLNTPEGAVSGEDAQLKAAVEQLLKDLAQN